MDKSPDTTIQSYYQNRAAVYDRVYSYPERQTDLRYLEAYISGQFSGLDLLEVAAGTGYWTQFIINKANSVTATDVTTEALAQINTRLLRKPVATKVVDAYSLAELGQTYNAAFAGLWLSHVPKQEVDCFLKNLHQQLEIGSKVIFIDNSRAQCDRLPLAGADEFGNTYQDRVLDGDVYRVLKNFPSHDELVELTATYGTIQHYEELDNYWLFEYISASPTNETDY